MEDLCEGDPPIEALKGDDSAVALDASVADRDQRVIAPVGEAREALGQGRATLRVRLEVGADEAEADHLAALEVDGRPCGAEAGGAGALGLGAYELESIADLLAGATFHGALPRQRPVLPKPPAPRSAGGKASTSTSSGRAIGATTSWATRSPCRTSKAWALRLMRMIPSSPR